ncbi:hypothetical protein BBJ28_00027059, partial [Nothophytophthora sp. Chile5]
RVNTLKAAVDAGAAPAQRKKARQSLGEAKQQADGASSSLVDLVTLLHHQLIPFLEPQDLVKLLACCSHSLKQDLRDTIATAGLVRYYRRDSVHFGNKCNGDWHQLVPTSTQGARGRCACNWDTHTRQEIVPKELPLPKILDARAHLLEAMCLVYEGIQPHCFTVLQIARGFQHMQYGTLQPVVFSLAAALEKEQRTASNSNEEELTIDTDDVEELVRLMDSVELGMGFRFFSSRDEKRSPANVFEAHWRGIQVDLATDTSACEFCGHYEDSSLFLRSHGVTPEDQDALLRAHCVAVYQPLKKFMMRHLKHVQYVRPVRGWSNDGDSDYFGDAFLDLVGGFTSAGVLCGVYLTDIGIPNRWIRSRLAPGHFQYDED